MEEHDTIVLELTPREAAVIRRLASFLAWDGGDFGPEMRSIYKALSDHSIMMHIGHIEPCVRYRDTKRLMPVNGLIVDDLGLKVISIRGLDND